MINQKKLLLLFLFFCPVFIVAAQAMYVGKIQFPACVENPPAMPSILYKGGEHCVDSDKHDTRVPRRATYEIYENRICPEFYILITQDLKRPQANDFAHLETSKQHSYALYHAKRMVTIKTLVDEHQTSTASPLNPGEKMEYWHISKIENNEPEIVLPDHTLIFLMNPAFVEVVSETWRPDDAIIPLPTLKFTDSVDADTLHTIGAKMVCTLLDFKCIHKKPTKTIAAFAQNRTIAVHNPLNRYLVNS